MAHFSALLIEDDEDDYVLTLDLLEEIHGENVHLDWAKNADEARACFKSQSHDICLMDYRLGSETGVELLKQATKLGYDTPIIMLTGQKDKSVDHSASEAGAADYLLKSELNAENLDRAIRYALSRREIQKARLESLRAEEKSRFKTKFLAHLSHELRTPLTAILGFAENLSTTLSEPDNKEKVNIIYQNGKHLLSLLNDVLDISKIEAGKLSIERQEIDLFSLIEEINALMSAHANDKNLDFSLVADDPLPRYINTDPKRLKQIILNLVSNAIKFTPKGKISVNLFLSGESQENLCIKVSDTGIGISDKDLDKIFEAFERATDTQGRLSQGTGLGLAISMQLAEKLDGTITVRSSLNNGSEFTLSTYIGAQNPDDLSEFVLRSPKTSLPSDLSIPQFSGNVLIVDDIRDIRTLLSETLRKSGLEVTAVENGLQAIEICKTLSRQRRHFDIIFMDIDMPYMDGFQTAAALKELKIHSPIIAFTAAMMGDTQQKCQDNGMESILKKPIETEELECVLKKYLTDDNDTSSSTAFNAAQNKLLIVEDNVDAARAMAMLCEALGLEVTTVHSCEAALTLLQASLNSNAFSNVILDKNLPDGSGLDLAEKVKLQQPNIRIIIASGENLNSEDFTAIDACILKPLDLSQLRSALKIHH